MMKIFRHTQTLYAHAKKRADDFRLYDVGSYAINHFGQSKSFDTEQNIAYGLKARQRFDVYRAKQPLAHRPLIIFVYGGAWQHGDKKAYRFVGESFTREGYDVVVMNYHLAPQAIFPSYVDDLALLLHFLKQHQQRLKLQTDQIALMWHSAGAFNIMSVLYHPQQYQNFDVQMIKAVIGLAGPYHFDYKGDTLAEPAFHVDVPYQNVMPYYFVQPNHIRHYLLLAGRDKIVKDRNTEDMAQVLLQHGNHSEVIRIARTGHITIMGSVSSLFSRFFSTKKQILMALETALKPE